MRGAYGGVEPAKAEPDHPGPGGVDTGTALQRVGLADDFGITERAGGPNLGLPHFTLANCHHRSHPAQTQALHRYLRWRNANSRHPDVLAAQRKERARIRSEKGIRWRGRPLNAAA